jgi:hypothetical protein
MKCSRAIQVQCCSCSCSSMIDHSVHFFLAFSSVKLSQVLYVADVLILVCFCWNELACLSVIPVFVCYAVCSTFLRVPFLLKSFNFSLFPPGISVASSCAGWPRGISLQFPDLSEHLGNDWRCEYKYCRSTGGGTLISSKPSNVWSYNRQRSGNFVVAVVLPRRNM